MEQTTRTSKYEEDRRSWEVFLGSLRGEIAGILNKRKLTTKKRGKLTLFDSDCPSSVDYLRITAVKRWIHLWVKSG